MLSCTTLGFWRKRTFSRRQSQLLTRVATPEHGFPDPDYYDSYPQLHPPPFFLLSLLIQFQQHFRCRVSEVVTGLADPGANVIFGAVIDDAYDGEVHVTIIATGFTPSFEDNILAGKVRLWCEGVWREGF